MLAEILDVKLTIYTVFHDIRPTKETNKNIFSKLDINILI